MVELLRRCPGCRAVAVPEAVFCADCGRRLSEAEAEAEAVASVPVAPPRRPAKQLVLPGAAEGGCPNCGATDRAADGSCRACQRGAAAHSASDSAQSGAATAPAPLTQPAAPASAWVNEDRFAAAALQLSDAALGVQLRARPSFSEAVRRCLAQYATFSGRSRRSEYWWFALFFALVYFVGVLIDASVSDSSSLGGLLLLAFLLPMIAVTVRRLHDTGRSGWHCLLVLVPLVGSLVLIVFCAEDGGAGTNAYGVSPKWAV